MSEFSAAQVTINQDGIKVSEANPLPVTLAGGGAAGGATSDNQVTMIAVLDELQLETERVSGTNPRTVRLDEVSDTLFYVGKADVGTLDSASSWQIARFTTTSGVLKGEYANGSVAFDQKWNDRLTLTYS